MTVEELVPALSSETTLLGLRVLVVDDEALVAQDLCERLTELGAVAI